MLNSPSDWTDPAWQNAAKIWISERLSRLNIQLYGSIAQHHIRPWSTVMKVDTSIGDVFFKASAATFAHEAALTAYLSDSYQHCSPQLLALDLDRNWLLMRSSGVTLRSLIKTDQSITRWGQVLPRYVELQKRLATHSSSLLKLGVPDRRLKVLPDLFYELLQDKSGLLLGQPDGLSAADYQHIVALQSEFEDLCSQLAGYGIPETLHHDDFHDANIFFQEDRVIFTDWGECAITQPFFSLVVMLRSVENSLGLSPDAPQLDTLRGWYLDGWSEYGTSDELKAAARLSERIGYINRALTWHSVISHLSEELKPEYAAAVPAYLQEFIHLKLG